MSIPSAIDCGTCRWVAPESFNTYGTQSRTYRQPETAAPGDTRGSSSWAAAVN